MSEPYLGEITMFGGNFNPRGWARCDGQLLAIAQNSALFSLLGTTYGGDGRTTFALPDLRGRAPIHQGQGPGLVDRRIGSRSGREGVTLNANQLPPHTHDVTATIATSSSTASTNEPSGNVLASGKNIYKSLADVTPPTKIINSISLNRPLPDEGGNQAHNNMQPYVVITFIIALQGIFPSRN